MQPINSVSDDSWDINSPREFREAVRARYMEAVFTPGMTSAIQIHGGPEA
jgi:hypothetical protein